MAAAVRRCRPLALLWWLVAGLLPTACDRAGTSTPPGVGSRLPPLVYSSLDNRKGTPAEFAGKALVVNFWATWCLPCRAEMPSLQQLSDKFAAGDLVVLGLSADEDANLVREFVLRHDIRFDVGMDDRQPGMRRQLGVTALPTTLLVDADGRIAAIVTGQRDWASPAMVREIEQRLRRQAHGRPPPG
jgi:thiol-disulfide isomerase/thioredoxin